MHNGGQEGQSQLGRRSADVRISGRAGEGTEVVQNKKKGVFFSPPEVATTKTHLYDPVPVEPIFDL